MARFFFCDWEHHLWFIFLPYFLLYKRIFPTVSHHLQLKFQFKTAHVIFRIQMDIVLCKNIIGLYFVCLFLCRIWKKHKVCHIHIFSFFEINYCARFSQIEKKMRTENQIPSISGCSVLCHRICVALGACNLTPDFQACLKRWTCHLIEMCIFALESLIYKRCCVSGVGWT